jgi:hypothetical protein
LKPFPDGGKNNPSYFIIMKIKVAVLEEVIACNLPLLTNFGHLPFYKNNNKTNKKQKQNSYSEKKINQSLRVGIICQFYPQA